MKKQMKVNKQYLLSTLLLFECYSAQVKIGNSTENANPQSILQLENSVRDKGFLLTRLELQSNDLPNPLSSHVDGIIVYNTATAGTAPNNVSPGLYYNNGSAWIKMTTKTPKFGDIKNGFQNADHNGWFIVNGRAVSTLNVNQRAVAAALGFSTNLPDATDRFLKNTNGTDAVKTVAGADTFTISRANLPNVTFSGTTNTTGNHTHTYTDNPATTTNVAAGTNNPVGNNVTLNSTTFSSGTHTHTLSFALGSSQAVSLEPNNIITNVFIYLGN